MLRSATAPNQERNHVLCITIIRSLSRPALGRMHAVRDRIIMKTREDFDRGIRLFKD
jgi:hypothetical protein